MSCEAAAVPLFLSTALTGVAGKFVNILNEAVFVCQIREYLVSDMLIDTYRTLVAERLGTALMYMSTTIMTIWVAYHGFMIISGTSRQPFMALALQTGKMALILSLVALVARQSPVIADSVLDFQRLISATIVDEGSDIYRAIDLNVGLSVVFNAIVDSLVGGQQAGADGKSLTTIAGLIGQSGPAMVVSAYALAAEVFITLAIMLSPLFIFFLLFKQTAGHFWSWARYLLGTMFSLAILVLVGSVLLKMMMTYGAGVIAAFYLNAAQSVVSVDIAGSAMRMAMMGALSSALLLMIPPVIMGFFNSGASFAANALQGALAGAGGAAIMHAMQKSGSDGAAGAAGAAGGAGMLGSAGAAGADGGAAGSAAFNRQIYQHIASRSAQSSEDGGTRPLGAGYMGNAAGGGQGLPSAQYRQQSLDVAGELRENPKTGVYETVGTAQHLQDQSLGRGGHLTVGQASSSSSTASRTVSPASPVVAGNVVAHPAAGLSASNAGVSYAATASAPALPSSSPAPVHARPPTGIAQAATPRGAPTRLDAWSARELRNPAGPRPTV